MPWFSFHFADFAFSFLSILFEGVPFLLLGAIISGVVDVFVPARVLTRLLPQNPTAAVFLSGLLGGIFPMCECGSVVVIRRFLAKGLPVSCAVTYMLSAPIVSPLVALSTFAAFRGQSPWVMTSMRLFLGYAIAVGVGLIVQRIPLGTVLQRKLLESLPKPALPVLDLEPAAFSQGEANSRPSSRRGLHISPGVPSASVGDELEWKEPGVVSKLLQVVRSATSDFLDVALFFVIGAGIAATFNTAVDQSLILPLATNSVLSVLAMMGLAGAMALCSSTDAFIAATFVAFPFTAKLAFLVFGPVLDVKLFFLYGLVFRRKFIVCLAIGLFIAIALICIRMSDLNV